MAAIKVHYFLKANRYYIRWQVNKVRTKRSCKTDNEAKAQAIAKQVELLLIDPDSKVSPEAYVVFFGKLPDIKGSKELAAPLDIFDPNEDKDYVISYLTQENQELKKENDRLQVIEKKWNAYKLSQDAALMAKYESLPTFKETLADYTLNVRNLDIKGRNHIALINKLLGIDEKDKSKNISNSLITEIQEKHIYTFLENEVTTANPDDPGQHWNRKRTTLHRYFDWLSINYKIENIVKPVKTKPELPKAGIAWHEIDVIETELDNQGLYWAAVIAVMAYAGLSAHEVRGLKNEDYDGEYIKIRPSKERRTKNARRIGQVAAHKELLKPRLDEYLKTKKKSDLIFPSSTTGSEQWSKYVFSRHFRSALKNKDINALSLRRSFGSLLLRSDKTTAQVAAVMRNSPNMVDKHYAQLLSAEVPIDFKK